MSELYNTLLELKIMWTCLNVSRDLPHSYFFRNRRSKNLLVVEIVQPAAELPRFDLPSDSEPRTGIQRRVGRGQSRQGLREGLAKEGVPAHRCKVCEEVQHRRYAHVRNDL